MPGHIRKRDDKGKRIDGTTKWEAVWRNPLNPQERRSKTFRVKQIAARWLQQMDTDAYAGTYVDPRNQVITVAAIATEWQETWLNLEPKTIKGYTNVLSKHVIPAFGKHRVGAITPEQIQKWVNQLSATHRPNTTRNTFAVLRQLLKFATQRRYIAVNPASTIRLPKATDHDHGSQLFLSPAEVNQLAEAMPANYRMPVYVAAYCGLRAGELWALRRQDVDVIHGTIRISRAFKEVYGANQASGLILGAPKSRASNRQVSIPSPIKQLLVSYLASPVAGLGGNHKDSLIFTTINGLPVRHGRFYGKVFRPAVNRLWPESHRLHALRWHDLRHTCASLTLAITPNLHIVKERLGHESITTTIDIYGHLLPSVDAALMDGLGALFESAVKPPDNVRAIDRRAGAGGSP